MGKARHLNRYLPPHKAIWDCAADQENVNADKNPHQHQTNANWGVDEQQQESHGIFGKPVHRLFQFHRRKTK